MVRSTLLCRCVWGALRAKNQVQRKCGVFKKAPKNWCQQWKFQSKLVSKPNSLIFQHSNKCIESQRSKSLDAWIFGFLAGWGSTFAIFHKNPKCSPELPEARGKFNLHILIRKWCAALSSVVFSGGPFGQNFRFNTNVGFSKIHQRIHSEIESIIENESRLQNLQCLTIKIKVFNSKFGRDYVHNFCVFARP